ncbi:uncharacterized protein LOC111305176 [Durio zibethinus]|uniref:Uncharacterized protein LOC111305176 n=1 Tax=Durio zibethinus TaxID=66656 RepID=A0A6P5ZZL6_DURZI|nr:uncharacterized protein LOC111305176 [Durio zibethinus]
MVILPNPWSVKLQPSNSSPFSMPSLVSIGTGKHVSHVAVISTPKTSYQTISLDRFINNNLVLQESSSRRGQLFADKTLTTTDLGEKEGKSGYSSKMKTKQKDHESLETEIESIICRLKAAVERVRELETQKLMGRFKGTTMSDEDRLLVENTSREIVDTFLKRPVQYLKSVNGDFEEKLKDLNLLIRMLENSCLDYQR